MLELLRASLENAPAVKLQGYDYFVFPIADGVPAIEPELLTEVVDAIAECIGGDFDRIVAAEAMGIHLAAGVSLKTGKPFTIIRKRKYGLPDEKEFEQVTGYSSRKMYINGLKKGDKVLVLDDLISTGGTLIGILGALGQMGVEIVDVIIIIDKGNGRARVEEEFGIKVKTLIGIDIIDGRVKIRES